MVSKISGSAVHGVDAFTIAIEVNIVSGTKFYIVGLPDNAVKESERRVESSIKHLGFKFPRHRVVVNLAPADKRKEGSAYDLPIALGILISSKQIHVNGGLDKYMVMGELSLDGASSPIKGVLPIAI